MSPHAVYQHGDSMAMFLNADLDVTSVEVIFFAFLKKKIFSAFFKRFI